MGLRRVQEGVMRFIMWVIVHRKLGGSEVLRCASQREVYDTVYNNNYYGNRCLVVRVKEWK